MQQKSEPDGASPSSGAGRGPGPIPSRSPDASHWHVLRALAPFVWPSDRPDLQRTVCVSLGLMLAAKLVTVSMPYTFKWVTDALVAAAGGKIPDATTAGWLIGAPILATLVYGAARIGMVLLTQAREGLFAKVAMHAVRKLALSTFENMHRLSLRFIFGKISDPLRRFSRVKSHGNVSGLLVFNDIEQSLGEAVKRRRVDPGRSVDRAVHESEMSPVGQRHPIQ